MKTRLYRPWKNYRPHGEPLAGVQRGIAPTASHGSWGSWGCGAMSGFWKWLKPPHYRFFREACALHDELYMQGGTEADRKRADIRLYQDMVRLSVNHYRGRAVCSQAWFLFLAFVYYVAVRLFARGQFSYHDKEGKNTNNKRVRR